MPEQRLSNISGDILLTAVLQLVNTALVQWNVYHRWLTIFRAQFNTIREYGANRKMLRDHRHFHLFILF